MDYVGHMRNYQFFIEDLAHQGIRELYLSEMDSLPFHDVGGEEEEEKKLFFGLHELCFVLCIN
jgi:hypothetical protein